MSDKPVASGVGAIEVVPTDAAGEVDRSDELLKSVAFWCAVRQARVEAPHECQDEE